MQGYGQAGMCRAEQRSLDINQGKELANAFSMKEVSALARERYNELLALPHEADNVLGDGTARLFPIVTKAMRGVKEKVGLLKVKVAT